MDLSNPKSDLFSSVSVPKLSRSSSSSRSQTSSGLLAPPSRNEIVVLSDSDEDEVEREPPRPVRVGEESPHLWIDEEGAPHVSPRLASSSSQQKGEAPPPVLHSVPTRLQLSGQSSSVKNGLLSPSSPSGKMCMVCRKEISGGPCMLAAHVNECLAKAEMQRDWDLAQHVAHMTTP